MSLAKEETERRGFDLLILLGRVAHKRTPQVRFLAALGLGSATEQVPRHLPFIVEIALRFRAVVRALRKLVVMCECRCSLRSGVADGCCRLRLSQEQNRAQRRAVEVPRGAWTPTRPRSL